MEWESFVQNAVQNARKIPGITRLAENVWLVDLMQSVDGFAVLAGFAQRHRIPYGILSFAEPPQWLPASYNPRALSSRFDE